MQLFTRKAKGPQRKEIELLSNADGAIQIAFGLTWSSIVSNGVKATALKLAKDRGASHLLFRGQQVGYGFIDTKKTVLEEGVRIFPAAQIVARRFGGDGIHALKVSGGEYWLAVVRNSQPTSVDQWIVSDDDTAITAEVEKLLRAAAEEGIQYAVYTNLEDHPFGKSQRVSAEDLFRAISQDSEFMEALPKGSSLSLPKPVLIAIGIALALGLGQTGWKWKKARDAKRAAAMQVQDDDLPPAVAWAKAAADWEKAHTAANPSGLNAVRESIGSAPVKLNGWLLIHLTCNALDGSGAAGNAAPANGTNLRTWSCSATYLREKLGALNSEIAQKFPAGWNVSFKPLNELSVSWQVPEQVAPLQIAQLKPVNFHLLETVSKLQQISPTLGQDVTLAFTPVAITPPKRANGKPYEPDGTLSGLQNAPLTLKAPLRSIDAISRSDLPVDWNSISLEVADVKAKGASSTISQSALTANVTGVIYAKNR